MKKICLSIWVLLIFHHASTANSPHNIPTHSTWPAVKLSCCMDISFSEIERLSGRKLNLFQRMSIRIFRNKMKKAVRKDPEITLDQFMRARKTSDTVGAGLLIFVILGLVLVIMMLVFHRSYDP